MVAEQETRINLIEKAKVLVELTRPMNVLMVALAVVIAVIVGVGSNISLKIVIPAILSAVSISAAGNALNDYYDQAIDDVNKPDRPLPSKKITPTGVWVYAILLFGIGIILSLLLPVICIIIAVVNSILLGLYAANLKRSGFFGNVLVSYLVASVFAFAGAAVNHLLIGIFLAIVAFFTNAAREILKDLEDVKGDEIAGAKTLPTEKGWKRSMAIVASFLIIAILVSPLPYLLEILSLYYLIVALIADIIFVWIIFQIMKKPTIKSARINQKRVKIAALIGLLAFVAGIIPW